MPKSKKKKADFQKVKLKVGRRLPRGENETSTSFKSRTIQIVQHIKDTTKQKQSLEDLLPQCEHYNARIRLNGVQGITDLITIDPAAVLHEIFRIFSKIPPLLCDKDPPVRQAVLKLFKIIFQHMDSKLMSSFFRLVSVHLCCAMTHLGEEVRQDSLEFFDLLLDAFPELVTGQINRLVPVFLEQISSQVSAGKKDGMRMLLVDPNSRLSSQKWRSKILERLKKLVNAFLDKESTKIGDLTKGIPQWCLDLYQGIYPYQTMHTWFQPPLILHHDVERESELNEYCNILTNAKSLQKFVVMLLPLLKQCWTEDCPGELTSTKEDQKLTEKALPLLISIVGILQSLIKCWDQLQTKTELDKWFCTTFFEEIKQLLMLRFPLVFTEKVKRKKDELENKMSTQQAMVLKLNLSVCDILASFPRKTEPQGKTTGRDGLWQVEIVSYLLNIIGMCTTPELGKIMAQLLRKVFFNFPVKKKLKDLFQAAFFQYKVSHPLSSEKRLYISLFESLSLDDSSPFNNRSEMFDEFIRSLIDLLLSLETEPGKKTAQQILEVLCRGGRQNYPCVVTITRCSMEQLYDPVTGILATAHSDVHKTAVELIHWLYRSEVPSLEQLQMFAGNIRLPQVDVGLAIYCTDFLKDSFWPACPEERKMRIPELHKIFSFLMGVTLGQTRTEMEALQSQYPAISSSLYRIVWNCTFEQSERHAALVQRCCGHFRSFHSPAIMFDTMAQIWTKKVLSCYHSMSVYMVYGILTQWSDMMQALLLPEENRIDIPSAGKVGQAGASNHHTAVVGLVERYIRDISRLCVSVVHDILARELADGFELDIPEEVADLIWRAVIHLSSRSLNILIKMCQLMTDLVTDKPSEKLSSIVMLAVTRLLQSPGLCAVWSSDLGEAAQQLENLKAVIQVSTPEVTNIQLWHNFVFALQMHCEHVQNASGEC